MVVGESRIGEKNALSDVGRTPRLYSKKLDFGVEEMVVNLFNARESCPEGVRKLLVLLCVENDYCSGTFVEYL